MPTPPTQLRPYIGDVAGLQEEMEEAHFDAAMPGWRTKKGYLAVQQPGATNYRHDGLVLTITFPDLIRKVERGHRLHRMYLSAESYGCYMEIEDADTVAFYTHPEAEHRQPASAADAERVKKILVERHLKEKQKTSGRARGIQVEDAPPGWENMLGKRTKNPAVGKHPDLFESDLVDVPGDPKKAMWAPEDTAVVVPLSEMTEDEILKTPRANFMPSEWDSLDEDVQEAIHENDPESAARIEKMVGEFVKRHNWLDGSDMAHLRDSFESDFDQMFSEYSDELVERARAKNYDVDEFIDEWKGQGYSEEQCESALKEALQDNNNYDYDYNTDEYHSAFFKAQASESFYIDRSDLDEILEGMYPDEIEVALKEINKKTYLSLKPNDLAGAYELDIYDYATFYADADPNWEKVIKAAQDTLENDVKRGAEDVEEAIDTRSFEDRIVHRFKDGSYVLDLQPGELAAEGKAMGMCVGREDMGYTKALRRGEIKILSLRTQAGRPKFTFEVEVEDGKPTRVVQIKGKANRLPGWDLGKAGQGKAKIDEIEKCIEVVKVLDLDPKDVEDLRPGRYALPEHPTQNPGRTCRKCGSLHDAGRKSFCDPVGA
jgi:hypothetical protein